MRGRVGAVLAVTAGLLAQVPVLGQAPRQGTSLPLLGSGADTSRLGTPERCAALAGLALPELASLEAELVGAGPFRLPAAGPAPAATENLPAFCRVRGIVTPEIRFEVWLPEPAAWNGRFRGVGGGGFAGTISYGAMVPALRGGYATASTDTGHTADDLEWLSDPRRLRDYGYRGIFEMTSKAKALVSEFYRRPADFDYFIGCSTGGRQGLMEAQRFAADYDGIVAGAPVNAFVDTHVTQLWTALAAKPDRDEPNLSATDLAFVNEAVIAQCDTLDGIRDGVLEDPARCSFDPGQLQCRVGTSAQCLRPDQVATLRRVYSGPVNPATGERLYPGLAQGGEATWSVVTAPGLVSIPLEFFRRTVFDNPNWDWRSFDLASDSALAHDETGPVLDAVDPDLAAFRDAGGKLIVYHGWNDQVIPPEGSIEYYENVERTLATAPNPSGQRVPDFFRLFMVPGMTHCAGGPGTSSFDATRAIESWVERGIAPDRIEASRPPPGEPRTRPLCPYPSRATYRGTGDPDRAASFNCAR